MLEGFVIFSLKADDIRITFMSMCIDASRPDGPVVGRLRLSCTASEYKMAG
jgi:hypothetical protein